MLSDQDIDTLMKAFATKQDANDLKESIGELQEKMGTFEETQRKILSSVESFASMKDRKTFEDAARNAQQSRHHKWIHQIARRPA